MQQEALGLPQVDLLQHLALVGQVMLMMARAVLRWWLLHLLVWSQKDPKELVGLFFSARLGKSTSALPCLEAGSGLCPTSDLGYLISL